MSQLSKSSHKGLYGSSGVTFPNNTTGEISEADMRQFGEDTADSAMFISDNFIDEDSFASDSATKAPSQQSVKAYINSGAGAVNDTDLKHFEQSDWICNGSTSVAGWGSTSVAGGVVGNDGYGEDNTEHAMGTLFVSTSTGTTGFMQVHRGFIYMGNSVNIKFRMRLSLQNLSDGTDTYIFRAGFTNNILSGGDPANGAFFKYTHATNGGEYQAITTSSSTPTTTDTNVAATTTYKIFHIEYTAAAGEFKFYIDGVLVATHTTNTPIGVLQYLFFHIEKTAGTTARKAVIDWHDLLLTRTTVR